jgi:hypothetical protein
LISASAYTLVFALLESLALLVILIFLSILLPTRILRDRFVAQSAMAVFLTSIWAVVLHYGLIWPWEGDVWSFMWLVAYLALLGGCAMLVHSSKTLERSIKAFIGRLSLLSYVYVFLGLLSIIVVILRNVVRALS